MSYILAIVILLIFSAFFSSSETILFLAKDLGLRKNKLKYKYIYENQEEFLTIILFSNTIINIFLGMIFEYYASNVLFNNINIIYVILSTTFILLIFGEVLPKRLSLAFYKILYEKYFKILIFFEKGLKHINLFFDLIIKPFKKIKKEEQYFTYNETKSFLFDSYKNKIISDLEFYLFYRLFNLNKTKVSHLIIPYTRIKVFTLNKIENIIKNKFEIIINLKQDIIPIFDNNFENIIVAIEKKKLIKWYYKIISYNTDKYNKDTLVENILNKNNINKVNSKNTSLKLDNFKIDDINEIIVKPVFVYIEQQLDQVIKIFNENSCKFIFVVDQYFQFKGIIRYSDIQNYFLTLDIKNTAREFEINPAISNEELKYYYNISLPTKYKNLHQFLLPFLMKDKKIVKYKKFTFIIYKDISLSNNIDKKIGYKKENKNKVNLNNNNLIFPNYKVKVVRS